MKDTMDIKTKDTLIITYDKNVGDDVTTMIVWRRCEGHNLKYINSFTGKEAEEMYEMMKGKEKV